MTDKRIGIIGGGQLGKMLCSVGFQMGMNISTLDSSRAFPAGMICQSFTEGSITAYDDIMSFGMDMDILTIEIEKVNIEALSDLEKEGKEVHPSPAIIRMIQDKGLQKDFMQKHNLPTSDYCLISNKEKLLRKIENGSIKFPFVQKLCKDGYDGRGVTICRSNKDFENLFDAPSVIEDLVDIEKELAIIVCRNSDGQIVLYDPVEMVFDPKANLLDYQLAPALISPNLLLQANKIAYEIATTLELVGNIAVELFLTSNGKILINEMAPRPHNSGHHTIEACHTSQYENLLRAVCNLPLGSPKTVSKSLLYNLLGSLDYEGKAEYQGINEILSITGSNLHLYGKEISKPNRKMGHVTVVLDENKDPQNYIDIIKNNFATYRSNKI